MNIISVIIPMFNEQKNIKNCLDTLKNQNSQAFEAIFIDDGSTDGTIELLDKYLNELSIKFEYKILKQENSGAAEARKMGIEHSAKDYIIFYDCDDVISNDMISNFYNVYRSHKDLDILMPDMYIENKVKEWKEFAFYTDDIMLDSTECVIESLNGWRVHGCITIKKSIILKSYSDYLKYNTANVNYGNNDEVITRLNFSNSLKIMRTNSKYYYCFNNASTTKKINENRYLAISNAFILNDIYFKSNLIEASVRNELIAVLWGSVFYMMKYRSELNNIKNWKKNITESIDKIDYFESLLKVEFKRKVQLTFLKINKVFLGVL